MASQSDTLGVTAFPTDNLTPNTRTEAEAALSYNSLHQTISAAKPQPTTPSVHATGNALSSSTSTNSNNSGLHSHLPEPPYPTEETAERVRVNLSRGTTQAVLQKMQSGLDESTIYGRRASKDSASIAAGVAAMQGGGSRTENSKPVYNRQQSYSKEDMKHMMSQNLMRGDKPKDNQGYSSIS